MCFSNPELLGNFFSHFHCKNFYFLKFVAKLKNKKQKKKSRKCKNGKGTTIEYLRVNLPKLTPQNNPRIICLC
jgi:hypothetical protein